MTSLPIEPSDLIDPEAPAAGGAAVDTPAYAAPADGGMDKSVPPEDLIDVEAPAQGGVAVDTPAYAAAGSGAPTSEAASGIDAQAPPPPRAEPSFEGADDPWGGEAGGAPPRAGPELGGGESFGGPADPLDRAADALLRLAAERPWAEISLRDIAAEAGLGFAELYARAPGKGALLARLGARLDEAALEKIEGETAPAPRDRLFEALMSRLEVMQPHRDALLAIGRAQGAALAPAAPRTARALLEGSGIDTGGWRGAVRLAAVSAIWARTLQVWRDDEGAYNRTMAEIDRRLAQADKRLQRLGAGF